MSSGEDLPSDVENEASSLISNLVPEKSGKKYQLVYDRYEKWCREKKIIDMANEKGLLVYFNELSKTQKPSSLWCYYSMLRTQILLKYNIDIKKYVNVIVFLKRKSEGYKPKMSRIFTKKEISRFLINAADEKFLCMKVILIIGLAGACRREELSNLLVENVKDEGLCFQIVIPNTKTKVSREFFITSGNIDGLNLVEVVRSYFKLRPNNCGHGRFFVGYRTGKCIKQPIGVNTFGSVPKFIAQFLGLPNPKEYTGHCFRRSSTSLLADSGVDLLCIKRQGGWTSNSVAEGYIETSIENKKRTAMKILGENENISSKNESITSSSKNIITSKNFETQNICTSSTKSLDSSQEYETCMSSNSCIKTYECIAKIDLSPHGGNAYIDGEEFKNIGNDGIDSKITIKEEILPEIDTPCEEELLTNPPINNSISEYKFENIDINSDDESKPKVVEIKKEIFAYPETNELPESFDHLLTSFTDNTDAIDISIKKTESENDDIFSTACQYNFESVSESIPRCSIGTQTDEKKDSSTADSYFNLFVREYFKEAPDSTSDAFKKMLEIDGYILKLIKCRQNLFNNFDKPGKCTNSVIVPERLREADRLHVMESVTTEGKLSCSCHKNSELADCDEGIKTGARSGIEIVSSQIVPERLPDTDMLHSAIDLNIKESYNDSITMKRKLNCSYCENSEVAAYDEGTKTGGRGWRKTAKKRKFVNSQLQGNSEIAAYDDSTKNDESTCYVETESNISVPGCS